jgi:hypothetical protein
MALSKADKEFIELSLKPITQRLDTIQETNKKQDERLEKLEKTNQEKEKVFITMDNWVETRGLTCPNNPRIEEVEKVQRDAKVTKKFIAKLGAFIVGTVSLTLGAIKIVTLLLGG